MAVFRQAGKVMARLVPAVLVARLGLDALGALVFMAVLVVGVACWVVCDDARTNRVSRLLLAWRGNASCLGPGGTAAPPQVAPRPRHWPWPRRA